MAPGLRSGHIGHPEEVVGAGGADLAAAGGHSPRRTDTRGEGRCLRTNRRAGAAGMLANCLLSAGTFLILVRCALAAEGKHTQRVTPSQLVQGKHTLIKCIMVCHTFTCVLQYVWLLLDLIVIRLKRIFCFTRAAFCNPHLFCCWVHDSQAVMDGAVVG